MDGEIKININKKKPKKDAKEYETETIEQLFDILTAKNYKRFLKDLKISIETFLIMKNMDKGIKMKKFTWIDD